MIDVAGRHPMWVSDGNVGLIEKRLLAVNSLDLDETVAYVGEWERVADSDLLLDDELALHTNNAEDPGSSTINLVDSTSYNFDRVRGVTSNMALSDFAHAALVGYTPPGSGTGDPDLNKHTMLASEAIVVGQPVYVSTSNTVSLSSADPGSPASYQQCYPVGFANSTTTGAGQSIEVLTEGHIERSDWTSVTGTTNLVAGEKYFLDVVAGHISTTPTSTDGFVVVPVGVALTTKKLDIEIGEGVIL